MIDWISAILPVDEIMPGGHVLKLSPDGEVVSTNVLPFQVVGSYSSQVTVCNIAARREMRGKPLSNVNLHQTYVYISGNPSKYLQGHNIYGTNDLKALASKFFARIAHDLGFSVDVQDRWAHLGISGRYELTRIDITESFRVEGNNDQVSRWIYAAHKNARVSHKQSSLSGGDTLYFGKNSRRHTIKIYNKFKELIKHPIDSRLQKYSSKMLIDAVNLLRVEVTYRAQKLREMGYDMARTIDQNVIRGFFNDSVKAIKLNAQIPSFAVTREQVGRAVYSTYLEWLQGGILFDSLSKSTFYRHRQTLLEYDIDISLPRDTDQPLNNVIPLLRVIEASPAKMPRFYKSEMLLAA